MLAADYKLRRTGPDLKEHVISVLRSATIDSATDPSITKVSIMKP